MSCDIVSLCKNGDLKGVKGALENGADVNTWSDKVEDGWTGLMEAVNNHHNSVVALLLSEPNIDVNWKSEWDNCALFVALARKNNEALNLLLKSSRIDVDVVDDCGRSAVIQAIILVNFPGLKQLLREAIIKKSHKTVDLFRTSLSPPPRAR